MKSESRIFVAGHRGWRHRISLGEGIERTHEWFLANQTAARGISAISAPSVVT